MDRRAVTVSDTDVFNTISWIMTALRVLFILLNVAIDFIPLGYFTPDKLTVSKSVSRGNMAPLNVDDSYTEMKDYVRLCLYKNIVYLIANYIVTHELSSFTV